MKFVEIGFGNRWFIRTEIEDSNGTEMEFKGVIKPIRPRSIYIRIWIYKQVMIIDSREGLKLKKKSKKGLKIIFGVTSE